MRVKQTEEEMFLCACEINDRSEHFVMCACAVVFRKQPYLRKCVCVSVRACVFVLR